MPKSTQEIYLTRRGKRGQRDHMAKFTTDLVLEVSHNPDS